MTPGEQSERDQSEVKIQRVTNGWILRLHNKWYVFTAPEPLIFKVEEIVRNMIPKDLAKKHQVAKQRDEQERAEAPWTAD